MLDNKGFDKWAGEYDKSIAESSIGYPFEGYYDVLAAVHALISEPNGKKILDIGIGTGLLTNELYKKGANIVGLDFSSSMIKEAKIKMPKGTFFNCDMKDGIPEEIRSEKFDYIVSSYVIHHLDKNEKIKFIATLKDVLNEDCPIILADVSFENRDAMDRCQVESGYGWDEDEEYIVFEELKDPFLAIGLNSTYTQVSKYAGVVELRKR